MLAGLDWTERPRADDVPGTRLEIPIYFYCLASDRSVEPLLAEVNEIWAPADIGWKLAGMTGDLPPAELGEARYPKNAVHVMLCPLDREPEAPLIILRDEDGARLLAHRLGEKLNLAICHAGERLMRVDGAGTRLIEDEIRLARQEVVRCFHAMGRGNLTLRIRVHTMTHETLGTARSEDDVRTVLESLDRIFQPVGIAFKLVGMQQRAIPIEDMLAALPQAGASASCARLIQRPEYDSHAINLYLVSRIMRNDGLLGTTQSYKTRCLVIMSDEVASNNPTHLIQAIGFLCGQPLDAPVNPVHLRNIR
ncbi:MAG: hypothetical protein ACYCW6_31940, partial [Candidatus Xenobia bacterium]